MDEPGSQRNASHCPVCKKPYTNASDARAKSRHRSYCRKKYQSGPYSRRKACDECVRSKVRCSADPKGCSRCAERGVTCIYQGTLKQDTNIANSGFEEVATSLRLNDATDVDVQSAGLNESMPDDLNGPSVRTEETNWNSTLSFEIFNWERNLFDPEWSSASDLTTSLAEGYALESPIDTSPSHSELHTASTTLTIPQQLIQAPSSIPASLAFQDPSSLFERRKFSEQDLELTSDLALHILRSYPYMIASQDSVPPFIHPKYRILSEHETKRPSSLDAALKFAKMLLHSRRVNGSLVWGLIRMEQERIFSEYRSFNRWEVLEALQSLIMYTLLRIVEGRRVYTSFGTQLLASITALCNHISANFGNMIDSDELSGQMILWKDWVYFESRRRTATIALIITSVIHAQVTTPCHAIPEYNRSLAPSPKALWHAENEMDWVVGYTDYLDANAAHGMLRNSDLVGLKGVAGEQHNRWYAHADSFGHFVTLMSDMIV
ncbi:hypothetical protein DM02DRAFT_615606 [Periconia macrospinosa]|uniref:Zn(2)-C6 fungal-type domain-containing protein n=1 Tax=Periconia macrospinosa TaxID=97972 RepID=A0A2V1DLF3_9PLEO|nr:hypothetical protein DM02DRAFT_615606 [Periconia macrospinosa]